MADQPNAPQIQTPVTVVDPFSAIGQTNQPTRPRNTNGTFTSSAPSQQQPASQPAQATAHPDWLVSQAFVLGFEEEDIQAMSSDALNRAVRQLFRVQQASQQENARARTLTNSEPQQLPAPPGPQDPWATVDFSIMDPSIAQAIRNLRDETKRINALENSYVQDRQRVAKRQMDQNSELIDDGFELLIAKMGPQGEALYGKGSSRTLNPQSPEFKRRMSALGGGGVDVSNVNPHRVISQIEKGHHVIFGPLSRGAEPQANGQAQNPYAQAQAASPQNPAQPHAQVFTEQQWNQGGLLRPTDRQEVPVENGYDKAVQNLQVRMNENRQRQQVSDLGMFR